MTRDDYTEPDLRDVEAEAIEAEDAADERAVDMRRETLADAWTCGDYLQPGEIAALSAQVHALDRIHAAVQRPAVAEYAVIEHARLLPVFEAACRWRDAGDAASADALVQMLADAVDRARGQQITGRAS